MVVQPRVICNSAELAEDGRGMRFAFESGGETVQAFALRFGGRVYAYVNRCAHTGIELDWMPAEFFDDSGLYLLCATHGAAYAPETGRCLAGPCRGAGLTPVPVTERDGKILLMERSRDG